MELINFSFFLLHLLPHPQNKRKNEELGSSRITL